MSKVPVVRSHEFNIYYEQINGLTFVHCDVFKWNKTVKEHLMIDFEIICELHKGPMYAYHLVGDRKHKKFLRMVGFKPLSKGYNKELKQIEIYIKE